MNTDPIADLLTRIRNASRAHHDNVTIPYSKIKEGILDILKKMKFVSDFKVTTNEKNFKEITVELLEERSNVTLKRISKPGQRIYVKSQDLKAVKNGLGITILSTSKGVMTNLQARKQNLGGELICEIY